MNGNFGDWVTLVELSSDLLDFEKIAEGYSVKKISQLNSELMRLTNTKLFHKSWIVLSILSKFLGYSWHPGLFFWSCPDSSGILGSSAKLGDFR